MSHGILKSAFTNQNLELEYRPHVDGDESADLVVIPSPAVMASQWEGTLTEEFARLLAAI